MKLEITNVETIADNRGFSIEVKNIEAQTKDASMKIEFELKSQKFDATSYRSDKDQPSTADFLKSMDAIDFNVTSLFFAKKAKKDSAITPEKNRIAFCKALKDVIDKVYTNLQSSRLEKLLFDHLKSVFGKDIPDITLDHDNYLCLGYVKFGIPPLVGKDPKILILGTFPGDESLQARHYYSSGKNCFWERIKALGIVKKSDFKDKNCKDPDFEKCEEALAKEGIVLWDIFEFVDRKGSLDDNITKGNYNKIVEFLGAHSTIKYIVLNGNKCKIAFENYVIQYPDSEKIIKELKEQIQVHTFISTSGSANPHVINRSANWNKINCFLLFECDDKTCACKTRLDLEKIKLPNKDKVSN